MRVVIAGGHGKIAMRLEYRLAARSDDAVGLIRSPAHRDDLRAAGAEPVLCDLEAAGVDEVAGHLAGADAVVFAAGAGPGSGAARKETVDHGAAVLFADAAMQAGVRRYLLVSSVGVDTPPKAGTDEVFAAYLRAKQAAEVDLLARDLDLTVLRPGSLTNAAATDRVLLAPPAGHRGEIPRDDVAAVLVALLDEPRTAGLVLELVGGDTPVADAVRALRQ